MITDACSTSWFVSSSTDSRGSSAGSENMGPGSLVSPCAAMSRTDYDDRTI